METVYKLIYLNSAISPKGKITPVAYERHHLFRICLITPPPLHLLPRYTTGPYICEDKNKKEEEQEVPRVSMIVDFSRGVEGRGCGRNLDTRTRLEISCAEICSIFPRFDKRCFYSTELW